MKQFYLETWLLLLFVVILNIQQQLKGKKMDKKVKKQVKKIAQIATGTLVATAGSLPSGISTVSKSVLR